MNPETVLYFIPDRRDQFSRLQERLEFLGARILGAGLSGGSWHVRATIGDGVRAEERDATDASGRRMRALRLDTVRAVRYVETYGEFLARQSPARADELDPGGSFHNLERDR